MDAKSNYVTVNGLRLHYVEWGKEDAPAIVLLHGLRAYGHWFDEFADVAKNHYRLLALDQRGRGESEWAKDGQYNTDAYVTDLEGLVDAKVPGKFVLAGHSMGGRIAVNYAARHPDRMAALLILDSAPESNPVGLKRIREELAETPMAFDSWKSARAFIRRLHAKPSEQHIDTRLHWMLKEDSLGKLVWRLDDAIFTQKVAPDPPEQTWAILKRIMCPTLIVRGDQSDVTSAEMVQRMIKLIPDSQSVEIADAGHMVLEDNPKSFNLTVMKFLQSVYPSVHTTQSPRKSVST